MFEELRLLGDTERSIVVETRARRRITNLVESEPGERERRIFQKIVDGFREPIIVRKEPTGIYNCAGHVWASRRTSLLDAANWKDILDDDGYRKVSWGIASAEAIHPGDLALYCDGQSGEFLHVAEVVELRQIGAGVAKPWVLSELNSGQGEVIHSFDDITFLKQVFSVTTEIWTDRPSNQSSLFSSLVIPS